MVQSGCFGEKADCELCGTLDVFTQCLFLVFSNRPNWACNEDLRCMVTNLRCFHIDTPKRREVMTARVILLFTDISPPHNGSPGRYHSLWCTGLMSTCCKSEFLRGGRGFEQSVKNVYVVIFFWQSWKPRKTCPRGVKQRKWSHKGSTIVPKVHHRGF